MSPYERLSNKQKKFVTAYLSFGFNATRAAREAGYKQPHVQSVRLIRLPLIKAAIEEAMNESAMKPAEILARITAIARGNIATYLKKDGSVDPDAIKDQGGLIRSYTQESRTTPAGVTTTRIRVDLYRADKALAQMGKAYQLWEKPLEAAPEESGKSPEEWENERNERRSQAEKTMSEFEDDNE